MTALYSRLPTSLVLTLVLTLVVGACGNQPTPSPSGTGGALDVLAVAGSSASTAPPTSAQPSPSTAGEPLPISGVWRVRKVLRPEDRSGVVEDPTFDEETYSVEASCDREPCDSVKVTTTPLGLTSPATIIDMTRSGTTYTSSGQLAQASSCVSGFGDRVDGGANTASTLQLWVSTDRPAGSSVASTASHGTIELDVAPTPIGEAAGCEPESAAFELSGRREEVAVRNPDGSSSTGREAAVGRDDRRAADAQRQGVRGDREVLLHQRRYIDRTRGERRTRRSEGMRHDRLRVVSRRRAPERLHADQSDRYAPVDPGIRRRRPARATSATRTSRPSTRSTSRAGRSPKRVPKRLLDWWRRIVDFIADHEAGHVRIGRDYIRRLNQRLVGKPCEDLGSIVQSWAGQHAAAQEAYDRSEYSRPWPQTGRGVLSQRPWRQMPRTISTFQSAASNSWRANVTVVADFDRQCPFVSYALDYE